MGMSPEDGREACKAVALHNIGVLRSFLAEQGVGTVDIAFNGCGDEGMIGDIETPEDPEEIFSAARFADARIEGLRDCLVGSGGWRAREAPPQSFRGACERVALSLLEVDYPGWETDDGSSGTVRVGPEKVAVDIRMMSVEVDTTWYDTVNGLEQTMPPVAGEGDDPPGP